ncbi:hypothetical protein H0H81_002771 [Sphagnurus paluster]|uniref:Uncharacterized protein n=1 Tax=Sphagnurus paluster TaxID=117069 RepID=A0A9P7KEX6_9AGAR|nr:hypothetical protein H0H81_002771 [Sphagnurus paluster]
MHPSPPHNHAPQAHCQHWPATPGTIAPTTDLTLKGKSGTLRLLAKTVYIPAALVQPKVNGQVDSRLQARKDLDSLCHELSSVRDRSEKAERLTSSLKVPAPNPANPNPTQTQPMHAEAVALITAAEERARAAEAACDDAETRRTQLIDAWGRLSQYLSQLDAAAVNARAGFTRVVNGSTPLTFAPIPTLGGRPTRGLAFATPFPSLPPHPSTTATRRPRTPSVDSHGMLPNKKSHGKYNLNAVYMETPRHHHHGHAQPQAAPRMILPPGEHPNKPSSLAHPHSRSSSRSPSLSLSVDEMLLATTTDGAQANGAANVNVNAAEAPQHHPQHIQQQQHRRPRSHQTHAQIHTPQPFELHDPHAVRRSYTANYPPHDAYRTSPKHSPPQMQQSLIVPLNLPPAGSVGPHAQPGQAREVQTHVFAPVITGAPVKKSKFLATRANAGANSNNANGAFFI